jgi:hypothetical protein
VGVAVNMLDLGWDFRNFVSATMKNGDLITPF